MKAVHNRFVPAGPAPRFGIMTERMPRPCADEIALALADALPRDAARRDEIIAVGMVATALIVGMSPDGRGEMVETFCELLRKSVKGELN